MDPSPRLTLPRRAVRAFAALAVTAIGAWLVLVALHKLQSPHAFAQTLADHGAIPGDLTTPAAWLVMLAELLAGVLALLLGIVSERWRAAALVLAPILLVFTLYAAYLTKHPPTHPSPCGCGLSRAVVEDWSPVLWRNLALLAGLAAAFRLVGPRPARPYTSPCPGTSPSTRVPSTPSPSDTST